MSYSLGIASAAYSDRAPRYVGGGSHIHRKLSDSLGLRPKCLSTVPLSSRYTLIKVKVKFKGQGRVGRGSGPSMGWVESGLVGLSHKILRLGWVGLRRVQC